MELIFDTKGNEKQKLAASYWLNDDVTDIVYGGSKGSGKSYLGVSLIFGDAFIYPGTHYFIARKKLNDIRKYTMPSIMEVFGHWGITQNLWSFNGQDNYFTLYNGSKIFLLDAKYLPSDPDYIRFGSMQNTRGWIEEAGEFEPKAFENLSASVGRWKNKEYGLTGKLLQTCNPAKNYLYSGYYKPNKINQLEYYKKFIQALPEDNKVLYSTGYFDHLSRTLSKTQKERLLFGNWEYDDDPDALCDYDKICDIFTNPHSISTNYYLTADIARMGSDKALIFVWRGWTVVEMVSFDVSRTTEIQTAITALRAKYRIGASNCIADEDGVGGGVVDNTRIQGFMNGSKALNGDNYYNLQSQCCFGLAEVINTNQLSFECVVAPAEQDLIKEELEQLKSYDSDNDGKLRILPKELIKQHIGRSPDYRDVIMMRKYFDLKKPVRMAYSVV